MGGGTSYLLPHLWKEDEPYCFDPYKYDQQFGFKEPRREIGEFEIGTQIRASSDICALSDTLLLSLKFQPPLWKR